MPTVIINSIASLSFDAAAYEMYLNRWITGIKSEYRFWNHVIKTKGSEWKTDWKNLISDTRAFNLDKYLDSSKTKFLDVGSGPFSSTGSKTVKTTLEFHAADPLAYGYRVLKSRNKIYTGIMPEFAMVELLTEKYGANEFDIVHMQNALDHSFNPLFGILQMLSVCKIGGKIILHHRQNEAENENYNGFHQWNLCTEDTEFIIWRPGIKYNITKILESYADVFIEDTQENWVGVVIEKKQDFDKKRGGDI